MTGTIRLNVDKLLKQSGATQIDLVRAGVSSMTANRLAHGVGGGITFDVLAILCDFFSTRMGRPVDVSEILVYEAEKNKN